MSPTIFKQRRLWEKTAISAIALLLPLLFFETAGFLKASELQFLEVMIKLRGVRSPNPNIILITEDDATMNALGTPLSRRYYTQLLQALQQYGVKTIFLDVQFSVQKDPATDAELATTLQKHEHVVQPFLFAYRWPEDPGDNAITLHDSLFSPFAARLRHAERLSLIWGDSVMLPHPQFIYPSAKAGLVFTIPDASGRYRQLPLLCKNLRQIYPAASLVTTAEFLKIPIDSLQIRRNFWGYHLTFPGALEVPVNREGQILLNYYGPLSTFPSYSVLQILESLQDIENRRAPRVPLRDFAGKIAVVGVDATLLKDIFVTPFAEDFPGMGLHATAVSNMLNGDSLRQWPWYVNTALALIFSLVLYGGLLILGAPDTARKTVYAVLVFAVIFLLFLGLAYQVLFKALNIAPAMLQTASVLALGFAATLFYEKSWHAKTLQQEVKNLQTQITARSTQIEVLNSAIQVRDGEYKNMTYLLAEFEQPVAAEGKTLQERMRVILGKIKEELAGLHQARQHLEHENETLKDRVTAILANVPVNPEPAPVVVAQPEIPQVTVEEVKRVMEQYKKFVDKAQLTHYFNPAFNMITAVMNGRLPGEAKKSKMQEIFSRIERISVYDSTVLITGAIGAGKTELAKAIHYHSRRKHKPFQYVNINAIPKDLMESHLFGHKKGAFTGSQYDLKGAFECANGGTILLDEIGDLGLESQGKLLQVLQDKKFTRVGTTESIEVDIRIIAATNKNLEQLIRENKFREDLYSRLNVINIEVPPLSERREEIPHFTHYFLANLNKEYDQQKRYSEDALMAMVLHYWRDNIRELHNAVQRAYVTDLDGIIRLEDLDEAIQESHRQTFNHEHVKIWEDLVATAKEAMESLLSACQKMMQAGNVEAALQAGQLQLEGVVYENCFDYLRACLENKGSSFPQDQRETLARQTMVALAERLAEWCRAQKLNTMEFCWKEIEKLLGRVRRQVDNWKHDVGLPPF